MANDKKFIVKNGLTAQNIAFVDDTQSASNTITATMLGDGTLSFSGTSGQLFSITDSMAGTIFSVNDISGVPSIEVDDDGTIRLAEFAGSVLIGTDSARGTNKLQVTGGITIGGYGEVIDSAGVWKGPLPGAVNDLFYENAQEVAANYTIPATRNAMTVGPININEGVTVTVSSGARWVVL